MFPSGRTDRSVPTVQIDSIGRNWRTCPTARIDRTGPSVPTDPIGRSNLKVSASCQI
jgi:hypothetical protein